MTTLVAWVGADSRGPASLNIATDSRLSRGISGVQKWDFGRKTFAASTTPDVFGYVHDVLFPSIILSQMVSLIDAGCLFCKDTPSDERFEIVFSHIKQSFNQYSNAMKEEFSIFHASRENSGMSSVFKLNMITARKGANSEWEVKQSPIPIPDVSSSLFFDGTGADIAEKWASRWDSSSQGQTSRAVYSGFCDAVLSGEDKFSSGAPQLVCLYRIGSGRSIGFAQNGVAYFAGTEILPLAKGNLSQIEWRNRFFERCNSEGNLLKGAQQHHVPKGLGNTKA